MNNFFKKIKPLVELFIRTNTLLLVSLTLTYFISRIILIDVKVVQKIYYLFPISLAFFLLEKSFRNYLQNRRISILSFTNSMILLILLFSPLVYSFSKNAHNLINNLLLIIGLLFLYFFKFSDKLKVEKIDNKNENFFLLSLVILFIIIKLPILNKTFTGNNTIKYNTYVEPAIHMVKNNNPFVVNIKYLANPITNVNGIDKELIGIPTLEWFLAATYKVFGLENIEVKTRIATSLIGFLILIISYKIVKKITNKTVSLFFLLLLITNPLFILITQLTVYDSVILLLFLISFLFFLKYEDEKKGKFLIYSSLFFSASFLSKEIAILWGLPFFIFYIIIKNKKDLNKTILEVILFVSFLIISFIFFKFWVEVLNYGKTISLISPVLMVILINSSVKKSETIFKKIDLTVKFLIKNKYLLFFIILLIGIFSAYVFKMKASGWSEFITDKEIIFYWPMYEYIFNSRQAYYISKLLFFISFLGFFAILKNKFIEKKFKNFIISFGLGLFIYLVLASKVIFFHNYYNINFIYLYLLGSAYFIYIITKNLKFNVKVLFIASLSALIYKNNLGVREELLLREKNGFAELSSYMKKNNDESNFYIDNDNTLSLTITTGMPRITNLNYESIQKDIKKIGFSETMKKYKIKYLVASQAIDYKKYAPVFTDMNLKELSSTDRTDLILIKFDKENLQTSNEEIIKKAIELEKEGLFDLEAEIGDYKVYNLWNN